MGKFGVTDRYPIPPRAAAALAKIPRLWRRSEQYERRVKTTAETAYGGTVSNCALALAVDDLKSADVCHPNERNNALTPKVLMMVGKNAEIEARAQLAPKYMTP